MNVGKLGPHGFEELILLADQFCRKLGISEGSGPAELFSFLEASGRDPLDGLMTSEDARASATSFLERFQNYSIKVVRQLAPTQEKYCKVIIEGETSPVLVALLSDCTSTLPTDMENLILLAIMQEKLNFLGVWSEGPEGWILNWRSKSSGLAIIAEPLPTKTEVTRTIAAFFGFEDAGLGLPAAPKSIALSSTTIHIGTPTCCFSEVQARLVFEAASTTHPKWRFLSLYRILENAYLRSIKEILLDEFDKDAGKAIEDAKKKLSSETNQLINLMRSLRLETEFVHFNDAFENQLALKNRYITALDKTAESDPNYRDRDVAVKAVVRFYKMRCSIAHAGTSSVIYEQLPDANAATIILLPTVEAIAFGCLNISLPTT